MNSKLFVFTGFLTVLAVGLIFFAIDSANLATDELVLGNGDVEAVTGIYERWRHAYERRGGSRSRLRLPLADPAEMAERGTQVRGAFDLDLLSGAVRVRLTGLKAGSFDVWLVDNRDGPGRSVMPEPGDRRVRLGALEAIDGAGMLETRLECPTLDRFSLDMVAVTRRGETPERGMVASGAASVMQRIYFGGQPWTVANVGEVVNVESKPSAFAFLLPKLAQADGRSRRLERVLGEQVARGREIFINETFGGNGRTCATCHHPENNHTIDPKFIASLPPTDPLFVAEYDPNLKDLENPALLRKLGLVLTNVDGFDRPGVLRSVPHTLSLATSAKTELRADGGDFDDDALFANALGWSGDGAPGTGSLREFTLGAIKQHFTKTLARRTGVDFRLPTDEELTALEIYLRSLGRAKDYNLAQLTFNSPWVERGKRLFDSKQNVTVNGQVVQGETANCNGCHQGAGANSSSTHANPTRNTGVENMADPVAHWLNADLPWDGGFGTGASAHCGPKYDQPCYGDGRFNTPPLVEAADTAPFFHNNAISTLEEAVAAYNGDGFNKSPGALTSSGKDRRVKLEASQVTAVAAFLRSLNAMENIRVSNRLARQAMALSGRAAREIAQLAAADTEDAIQVLEEGVLAPYPEALVKLKEAFSLEREAKEVFLPSKRRRLLQRAIDLKRDARVLIATCDAGFPDPNPADHNYGTNPVFSCDELS